MPSRGEVMWAPDLFKPDGGNPRTWLIVSGDRLPCPDEESIAVAFTTQSHHPGSFAVPSEAWVRGEPGTQSNVLAWSVATLKDDVHVAGVQGSVTNEFTDRVTTALVSYLDASTREDRDNLGPGQQRAWRGERAFAPRLNEAEFTSNRMSDL